MDMSSILFITSSLVPKIIIHRGNFVFVEKNEYVNSQLCFAPFVNFPFLLGSLVRDYERGAVLVKIVVAATSVQFSSVA